MERRLFRSSDCDVGLDARLAGAPGPVLLAIRGVWAPKTYLNELFDLLPDVDILLGDLPGTHDPPPPVSDIAAFGRVYDEVVQALAPDRTVVAFGASTGALAALALRSPQVRVKVAMEPFLSTGGLWPLILTARHFIKEAGNDPQMAKYAYDLFGILEKGGHDRWFDPLLDALDVPLHAIVGSIPLGKPRPLDGWPSLTDERTRARLAEHPRVTVHETPPGIGHDITGHPAGWPLVIDVLRRALAEAA